MAKHYPHYREAHHQHMNELDQMINAAEEDWRQRRKKLEEFAKEPISQEFRDAICHAGTPVVTCMCGRTYFVRNGEHMDDGELDDLLKKEKMFPEKYIGLTDTDSISFGDIEGAQYVWHCERCPRVKKVELWLIENRQLICDFLKARSKVMNKKANREAELVQNLPSDYPGS